MSSIYLQRSYLYLFITPLLIWSIYVLYNPSNGYNYQIYRCFSELSNSGYNIFYPSRTNICIDSQYLDFTPGNLFLYKIIFYIQAYVPRAWFIYQLFWAWCAIALAGVVAGRSSFGPARLWALAIIMVISPAWLFLSALSGEDKLINAAFPLLLCLLAPRHTAAALAAGALYAGISGFGLLYLPLLAVACWHRWPAHWSRLAVLAAIAAGLIAATWLIYWPDDKVMLANRAHRESLPPFWYSIWMLAPALFSPLLGKALTLAMAAFATLGYFRHRTGLLAAMIAIAFTYFLTTNFLNHNRIAPMLVLPLLALRKGPGWWIYAALAFAQLNIVLGFHVLHIPFPGPGPLPWALELEHVTLANMCLVGYLAMFFAGLTRTSAVGAPGWTPPVRSPLTPATLAPSLWRLAYAPHRRSRARSGFEEHDRGG
jgi:hypothetical protein